MKRIGLQALLIALFAFGFSPPLIAKPHIISPDNLGVDASWAVFKVDITTDKKTYAAGEKLVASITSSRDSYILVYYTNEEGWCQIIYPNSYESEDRVKAGKPFTLGDRPEVFTLEVDVEKTRDYLQVIATDEPISTASLNGIKDPAEFINRVRLILKERVHERARSKDRPKYVQGVFGIGTTDYLCNMSSYSPPAPALKPLPPEIPQGALPVITIRTVEAPSGNGRYTAGPGAPSKAAGTVQGSGYEVKGDSAEIRGTVSYGKGIRKVLVDGCEATIHRIGSSKALSMKSIAIEAPDEEILTILDFSYIIDRLGSSPREVTVTAEGMDGTKASRVLRLSGR